MKNDGSYEIMQIFITNHTSYKWLIEINWPIIMNVLCKSYDGIICIIKRQALSLIFIHRFPSWHTIYI